MGTGTVSRCRSDNNIFENLRFKFWVKNGPFQVKNRHFRTIFTFKDLRYHKKEIEVDDTTGTGIVCHCRSDKNIFENLGFNFCSKMVHFRSKIAIFSLFSLLKTTGTIKKTQKWMILFVLAPFFAAVQIQIFLKTRIPFLVKNYCRSDKNIFENLGFNFCSKMVHFRSKIAIFSLFSLLKTSGTIKKTQKWMILRLLAHFLQLFR